MLYSINKGDFFSLRLVMFKEAEHADFSNGFSLVLPPAIIRL